VVLDPPDAGFADTVARSTLDLYTRWRKVAAPASLFASGGGGWSKARIFPRCKEACSLGRFLPGMELFFKTRVCCAMYTHSGLMTLRRDSVGRNYRFIKSFPPNRPCPPKPVSPGV